MRVLVAYATRHGATAGIAERIAATLTAAGLSAEARPVEDVKDVEPYDAVVLGGAAYMFHWLKPAVTFSRRHRKELAARPVWLFSSGPLGTDLVDKDGKNVLDTTRPKEFDELTKLLHPRGEQVFFGAYDPDAPPAGLGERLVRHMPAARAAMPTGDFRDWPAIDAWAARIATDLGTGRAGGDMTDDRELAGLDPFGLLDKEAARLDAFFSGLGESGWTRASRCAGWTVRDVLGHLAAGEDYHRACLDGTVAGFLAGFAERGATDLDSGNALGVADYAALSSAEVLARWRAASAANRRRFRERGDGVVDTSIGNYPCRWQAFHVAAELATHADDISVPVTPGERAERTAWRARYSRFALAEAKPQLRISQAGARTVVTDGLNTVELDDDDLAEAVMGRLDETSGLSATLRALLSMMP